MAAGCELCEKPGGELVFQHPLYRVVLVDDANYPGFCRVILNEHVAEMSDLSIAERDMFMRGVWQVEAAVRAIMQPHKLNLASLGNVVPHLHWHVIPRYTDDLHFPQPIWGTPQRTPTSESLAARRALLPRLAERLRALDQQA